MTTEAIKAVATDPTTGCIGAQKFRAPLAPTKSSTSLLHVGHPIARKESIALIVGLCMEFREHPFLVDR